MSGFFSPAAAKMSMTPSDATALETSCRTACSMSSWRALAVGVRSWRGRPGRPEKIRHHRGWPIASSCGTARAKAWDSSVTAFEYPVFAVLLGENVLLGGGKEAEDVPMERPFVQPDQSKPWKMPQQISCFSSMTATASSWSIAVRPVPPLVGVGGEGVLQLVGESEVIDDQPAGLVLEYAVHAGDGLHQAVACAWACPRTSCAGTGRRSR